MITLAVDLQECSVSPPTFSANQSIIWCFLLSSSFLIMDYPQMSLNGIKTCTNTLCHQIRLLVVVCV